MKTILTILASVFIFWLGIKPSVYLSPLNLAMQDSGNYKVFKIDSINNYYLIYAKKEHTLFKIISKKEYPKNCRRILINHVYKFRLHSILSVKGQPIIAANEIMELSGWKIDESTVINFEGDSIKDLYYANNLKGLFFAKKK